MKLIEQIQIAAGFGPVDMQTAANEGDYVSLKDYNHVAIVLLKAAGTAGDDPTLTVEQAKDVAGTDAKALDFTVVHRKMGTLTAAAQGVFTKITQAAGNTYTHADLAENPAIIVIEFDGADLDVNNGFDCVRATVADVGGNAQLGCVFYLLSEPRYGQAILPSAIED